MIADHVRLLMNHSQTRICLIGGTFDPIHLGHTYIASQAVRELGLDKVIFLPCRQSPHKLDQDSAADHHRLEMCRLATAELPWAELSDHDLTAAGLSYSWRTAEHFRALYPDAQLFWLMGTDQWDALARWDRAEYFASLVEIIVHTRQSPPRQQDAFACIPLSGYLHPASATRIRTSLSDSESVSWLHAAVSAYIKENRLYLKSPLD